MSENNLILHPIDAFATFDVDRLIQSLQAIGFVSHNFTVERLEFNGQVHISHFYNTGDKFLDLILFNTSHPVGLLDMVDGDL